MNKLFILILFQFFIGINAFGQNTVYEFLGIGDWDDVSQWKDRLYPGETVDAEENVSVQGKITIPEGLTVTVSNGGGINMFSFSGDDTPGRGPGLTINGTFIMEEDSSVGLSGDLVVNGLYTNNGRLSSGEGSSFTISSSGVFNNFGKCTFDRINFVAINESGRLNNSGDFIFLATPDSNTIDGVVMNEPEALFSSDSEVLLTGSFFNSGELSISELLNSGELINNGRINGSSGLSSTKNFINAPNGVFTNNGIVFNWDLDFYNEGTFINNENSIFTLFMSTFLSRAGSNFTNMSTIDIIDQGSFILETDIENDGYIGASPATLPDFSLLIDTNGHTLINRGILGDVDEILNTTGVIINEEGGTVINTADFTTNETGENFINRGVLTGTNFTHIGDYTNTTGTIAPGSVSNVYREDEIIGTYNFTDNWNQEGATATVEIQIESETTFDKIISEKDINLSGILDVSFLPDVNDLEADSELIIIEGNSVSGTFETTNLPELPNGKSLEVIYEVNQVILRVRSAVLSIGGVEIENQKFAFYPNPTRDFIALNNVKIDSSIEIYNAIGQIIAVKKIPQNKTVDISELTKGIYFLRVDDISLGQMVKN